MTALQFVSAGAAQGLVRSLAAREGVEVHGQFGAVGAMWDALEAGAPCDVVILTRAQIDHLVGNGAVVPETIRDLGRAPTCIAVRAGAARPKVGNPEELRAALRAADAIYFPDPAKATAGIHFAKVLRELGVHDELATRFRTFPNGTTAMTEMAKAAGNPLGCTQATEILAVPGVVLVAPLPPGHELSTPYAAAVHARAVAAAEARRFVLALGDPASAESRRRAGFE